MAIWSHRASLSGEGRGQSGGLGRGASVQAPVALGRVRPLGLLQMLPEATDCPRQRHELKI